MRVLFMLFLIVGFMSCSSEDLKNVTQYDTLIDSLKTSMSASFEEQKGAILGDLDGLNAKLNTADSLLQECQGRAESFTIPRNNNLRIPDDHNVYIQDGHIVFERAID